MATVDVVDISNRKQGSVELSPAVFEADVKPDLFHAEVRRQLASRQRGTHSTKNRHAVSGGGAKPWRQKGTGRARQGTNRAPQWAGGGVVFGPVPRGHGHSLPKKVRRAALRGALSLRQREGAIVVVDELSLDGYKTKRIAEILGSLGIGDERVLIVLADADPIVEASTRNLPNASTLRVAGLNVYDVLRHTRLLLTRTALDALDARLAAPRGKGTKGDAS